MKYIWYITAFGLGFVASLFFLPEQKPLVEEKIVEVEIEGTCEECGQRGVDVNQAVVFKMAQEIVQNFQQASGGKLKFNIEEREIEEREDMSVIRGTYTSYTDTIVIDMSVIDSIEVVYETIAHEIGHDIRYDHLTDYERKVFTDISRETISDGERTFTQERGEEGFVSAYAKKNPLEDFAEMFGHYALYGYIDMSSFVRTGEYYDKLDFINDIYNGFRYVE